MALDMYLDRIRFVSAYYQSEGATIETYNTLRSLFPSSRSEDPVYFEVKENVIYWRKADAIHGWFVRNVQKGVDNYTEYNVSRDDLESLRKAVQSALDSPKDNTLLPPTEGFFFGSGERDEWYYSELERTLYMLDEVLSEPDAYGWTYRASW